MKCHFILLIALLTLTGCRDEEAAARAAKAAEEARIAREVARRVDLEHQVSVDRKPLLHTIRVVGFVVLAGGAVSGLVWLRQPRGSIHAGSNTSNYQTLPPQANDHYPVNPGRVLELPTPSPTRTHHRRRHHETPPRA